MRVLRAAVKAVLPDTVIYRLRRYLRRRERAAAPDYTSHGFNQDQQPLSALDPLSQAFHARGPWFTQFSIEGRHYGGKNAYEGDTRLVDYFEWCRPAGRILELGSFEGGHSLLIAAQPAVVSLVGLDGRDFLLARARFAAQVTGQVKVSFELCDFETDPLTRFGRFDSVFCSGLLYHLSRPWVFLRQIARVSDHLFLSTHYTIAVSESVAGYAGQRRVEHGYAGPLNGLNTFAFWLTVESLQRALAKAGFEIVQERRLPDWPNGPVINLYARKANSG